MKKVKAGYEILTEISPNGEKELKQIELAGRTCYKSEDSIDQDSAKKVCKSPYQERTRGYA